MCHNLLLCTRKKHNKIQNMFAYVNFPSWISPTVFPHLTIRWYAVMYLVAFAITFIFFRYQCKRGSLGYMNLEDSEDVFIYVIIGLIVGARVFSCLLYEGNSYYWTHPHKIFWPFSNGKFVGLPGMSYHGGVVGGIVGALLYIRKKNYKFFDISDVILAGLPLGYTFGRLGNFINGELWGRVTLTSHGMIFPYAPSFSTTQQWVREACDIANIQYSIGDYVNLPRYPSQLYEALGEGIILFFIMWFVIRKIAMKKKTGPGFITGSYFALYGIIRFIIEYYREPDEQLGFIFENFTMGQILCFMMIIGGILVIIYSLKTEPTVYKVKKAKHENKRKS